MYSATRFTKTILVVLLLISCSACQKQLKPSVGDETIRDNLSAPSAVAATTPVVVSSSCDYVLNEQALTNAGWIKTFEDNFSDDLSKWNAWYGGAYNNELQLYRADNLKLENGELVITANKEATALSGPTNPYDATAKNFQYTSGRIECKTNVSANTKTPKVRMVARIKLPAGYGMWGAFWSYGDPWPTQGEIDMVEARGQEAFKYQTNYFYGRARNRNLVSGGEGFITSTVDLTTCYHVYELVWEQNALTSYLDGIKVEVKSGGYVSNLFGKTERIVLNLAVGGDFFSNFNPAQIVTGKMYVDYVKVFTSK